VSAAAEVRLKRLAMRAERRGILEMDLILGGFARRDLAGLDPAGLDAFEALLEENDQDLLGWVTGQVPAPAGFAALVARIAAGAATGPASGGFEAV
jgi:antitoxin CptB